MKSPLLFQNQPAYELAEGPDRVIVAPQHGARILRWTHENREVITWPENADWTQILKVRGGNPVLFPFIARHFVDGAQNLWRDPAGVIRPMPQHGFARDAVFSVVTDADEASLRMRLADSEATRTFYPFAFQFDVVVTLHPGSRLEVRFETTNPGTESLPYYAGHHFYFAISHASRHEWSLDLPCKSWGRQDTAGAIVHEPATASKLRLDDPAIIDRFHIGMQTSRFALHHAQTGQRLTLDLAPQNSVPWYAVTTWTQQADSDFYCVEPWLGLPNAIHHAEGLRQVRPGACEIATCTLDASGW